jgi:PAS domain S-box-containing protein
VTRLLPRSGQVQFGAERFLAALVRSSDDAIIGKTRDGEVVFWNGAAERLYGYEAAEMMGRDISVVVPPHRLLELAEMMGQVSEGQTVNGLETERLRKDGAIVPVSVTVSPVLDDDGAVIGISTIARDLSEHVGQVSALREAER